MTKFFLRKGFHPSIKEPLLATEWGNPAQEV